MKKELKYYKYQMNTLALNILALVIYVVLDIIVGYTFNWTGGELTAFHYALIIVWLIIHELLHYAGFLTDKNVVSKDLLLGMRLEKGILYCMCKKPISKKSILIALNFPLFFIGILTLVIGYIINSYPLIFLSIINIAGASGDIIMTIQMLKMPKNINYVDGDDSIGYYILSDSDISKIKVPFLKLRNSDTYVPEKILSKETRKVIISKNSYIFLAIYLISCIILIFVK